ncbi:hypothetical protein AB834_03030 [PVC group bacterium (ex Bugula neritina AB1)]|nr:hypothetical protein AB834_03030 [PVC group bacterium (ex Bugula neritina AB1)]
MKKIKDILIEDIVCDYIPEVYIVKAQEVSFDVIKTPVLVLEKDEKYFLIDGRKRVAQAVYFKKRFIEAICLKDFNDYHEAVSLALKSNIFSMTFLDWANFFKQGRAKNLWPRSQETIFWDSIGSLYFSQRDKSYIDILCDIDDWIYEWVKVGRLKIESLLYVKEQDFKNIDRWVKLIVALKMNNNELKKWMRYTREICLKRSIDLEQLWEELNIDEIVKMDSPERVCYSKIFKNLWKKRFPIRHSAEKEIENLFQNLAAPENFTLQIPENLEGDYLTISLKCRNKKDLNSLVDWIKKSEEKIDDFFGWI